MSFCVKDIIIEPGLTLLGFTGHYYQIGVPTGFVREDGCHVLASILSPEYKLVITSIEGEYTTYADFAGELRLPQAPKTKIERILKEIEDGYLILEGSGKVPRVRVITDDAMAALRAEIS